MTRCISFIVLLGLATFCFAAEPADQLPQPHYRPQPTDPPWLATVVQFHGHLGPSVIAGARMGMIGLRAVDAKGYFDVEVICEGPLAKPPQSCFLDGIQVATGATLGKRTLQWVQADQLAVRFKNTRTGKAVVLRPTRTLLELLPLFTSQPKAEPGPKAGHLADNDHFEAVARKIAVMPQREIASITSIKGVWQRPASPDAEADAFESAKAWLALTDQGKYGESWDSASDYLKNAVGREVFVRSLTAARKPLGKLKSRELKSEKLKTSLPGAPDGKYVVIQFKTAFENKKSAIETVTPMLGKDGKWRVSGYYIR